MGTFSKFILFLQYPYVYNAVIVGILIALCASLLGVTLVLKRLSVIGDGLSHVAFGATAIGSAMNLSNNMPLVIIVTIISAIILLLTGANSRIKGDAAIAILSVSALGVGYLCMNAFSTSANLAGDVCTTLFGSTSMLTLTSLEVMLCVVMSILVVLFFILFYHRIFDITFDENFAKASGTKVGLYNFTLAVVVALVIVLAMKLVGALLITALIIFPALSAMRVFDSFRAVTICAAILSVLGAAIGLFISIVLGLPVGASIVVCDLFVFVLFNCIRGIYLLK